MSRRLLPLVFALGLALVACAEQREAQIGFGAGTAFVPQVADSQDNVGLYPSVATDPDGVPYVAYFGFPEDLAEGEVAIPRPVGSPSVPSVLVASAKDGIWTRGAVAMQAAIANVNIAYGAAEVPQLKSVKPENANGTAIAIADDGAMNVAWVADTGVWYAQNTGGTSFSASQIEKAKVKERGPIGQPSIALDAQGAPWVTYSKTTAKGQEVVVATQSGASWNTDVIATAPLKAGGSQPGRTAIATTSDGAPVVLFSDGSNVQAATSDSENGWTTFPVESGVDGAGLSVAADGDGTLHAAYYASGDIHTATSPDGTSWQTATVSSVGSGDNTAGEATGIATAGDGTTYVTWYDPSVDEIRLASGDGAEFSSIQTSGTKSGVLPSLAVDPDGNVFVGWYDETEQNLMLGEYGDVGELQFAVKSPTPAGPAAQPSASSSGGTTEECTAAQNGELTVSASGIAFDTNCIQIPSGQTVTIRFDNKDAGTPHNIAVYPSATELSKPLFRGDVVTGPDTADYEVGPLDEGEYYFHCDVHPDMNGTFEVVSSGGQGSGGGKSSGGGSGNVTTTVTASGLAFDTDQIDLVADKPAKLTFDNQDAGTPHNIAIYPSEGDLTKPLFRGDVVTGPTKVTYDIPGLKAGTYYFHCDVHPTMSGSVVVS